MNAPLPATAHVPWCALPEEHRGDCPDPASDPLCQCQGCGAVRGIAWLGRPHACWRNEDGTYEEGGTFQ